MPGRKSSSLKGLEQVRALSHPLRLRLMELFASRPLTTKQAADILGQPPTRLYHHVAALEHAGLVRLRKTRKNRGTTEKYFETVTNRLTASQSEVANGTAADRAAMGMIVFDQSRNELVQALAAGIDATGPLIATRSVLQMSPRAAKKVAAELTRLLRRLSPAANSATAKRPGKLRGYSLTIALIPTDHGPSRS